MQKVWICKKQTFTHTQRFKPNDKIMGETAPNQHFFELKNDPVSPKTADEALDDRLRELGYEKIEKTWSFETKQSLIEKKEKESVKSVNREQMIDEMVKAGYRVNPTISDANLEIKYKNFQTEPLKADNDEED